MIRSWRVSAGWIPSSTTEAERVTDRLVDELEAEARYRRERLALYRARTYGAWAPERS